MDVYLNTSTVYGKKPTATTVNTYHAQKWTTALRLVYTGAVTKSKGYGRYRGLSRRLRTA